MPNDKSLIKDSHTWYKNRYGEDAGSFNDFAEINYKDTSAMRDLFNDLQTNGDLDADWTFEDYRDLYNEDYNRTFGQKSQQPAPQPQSQPSVTPAEKSNIDAAAARWTNPSFNASTGAYNPALGPLMSQADDVAAANAAAAEQAAKPKRKKVVADKVRPDLEKDLAEAIPEEERLTDLEKAVYTEYAEELKDAASSVPDVSTDVPQDFNDYSVAPEINSEKWWDDRMAEAQAERLMKEYYKEQGVPLVGESSKIDWEKMNAEAYEDLSSYASALRKYESNSPAAYSTVGMNYYTYKPNYVSSTKEGQKEIDAARRGVAAAQVIMDMSTLNENLEKGLSGERSKVIAGWLDEKWEDVVSLGVTGMARSRALYDIAKRAYEGKELMPVEQRALTAMLGNQELSSELYKSWGAKFGAGARGIVEFMAEMMLTKGVGGAVKGGTTAIKLASKGLLKSVTVSGKGVARALAAAGVQAMVMPSTYEHMTQNMLGLYDIGVAYGDDGKFSTIVERNNKSLGGAMYKAWAGQAGMLFTFDMIGQLKPAVAASLAQSKQFGQPIRNILRWEERLEKSKKAMDKATSSLIKNVGGSVEMPVTMRLANMVSALATMDKEEIAGMFDWDQITVDLAVGFALGGTRDILALGNRGVQKIDRFAENRKIQRRYRKDLSEWAGKKYDDPNVNAVKDEAVAVLREDMDGTHQFKSMPLKMKAVGQKAQTAIKYLEFKEEKLQEEWDSKTTTEERKAEIEEEMGRMQMELDQWTEVIATMSQMETVALRGKGMVQGLAEELKDVVGEFESRSSTWPTVTVVRDRSTGENLYLLDDKGDVSVVRGMTKDAQVKTLKSSEYDIVFSTPLEEYVARVGVMGQELAQEFGEVRGEFDPSVTMANSIKEAQRRAAEESQAPTEEAPAAETEAERAPVEDAAVETPVEETRTEVPVEETRTEAEVPVEEARTETETPRFEVGEEVEYNGERVEVLGIYEDGTVAVLTEEGRALVRPEELTSLRPEAERAAAETPVEQAPVVENAAGETPAGDVPAVAAEESAPMEQAPAAEERPPLPTQKNGKVDYNTLLQEDPARFIEEWDKIGGPGAGVKAITEARESINAQIEKMQKAMEKPSDDFNKRAADMEKLRELQAKKEAMDKALEPYEKAVDKIDEMVAKGEVPGLGEKTEDVRQEDTKPEAVPEVKPEENAPEVKPEEEETKPEVKKTVVEEERPLSETVEPVKDAPVVEDIKPAEEKPKAEKPKAQPKKAASKLVEKTAKAAEGDISQTVEKRRKKLKKSFNPYDFTAKDPLRPVLGAVFHDSDGGWGVASNAHILVAAKELYNPERAGGIIDKDGMYITGSGKYPNWKKIIPTQPGKPIQNSYEQILGAIEKFKAEVKAIKEQIKETGTEKSKFSKSLNTDVENTQVALTVDGETAYFKLSFLEKFLDAALRFDAKPEDIQFYGHNKALVINNENAKVLVMPMREGNGDVSRIDLKTGEVKLSDSMKDTRAEVGETVQRLRDAREENIRTKGGAVKESGSAFKRSLMERAKKGERLVDNALVKAATDKLRNAGVQVITDDETGQKVYDLYSRNEKLKNEVESLRSRADAEPERRAEIEEEIRSREAEISENLAKAEKIAGKDIRFFKGENGESLGFVAGGRIYLDSKASASVPIHEYTHLWAEMFRRMNPKEWNHIVELMKGKTSMWDAIRDRYGYKDGVNDDQIADEVLAWYSGTRGEVRLRQEMKALEQDKSLNLSMRAKAMRAFQNIRDAVDQFWRNVADYFGIKFTSAADIADRVLSDLDRGVNPIKVMEKLPEAERQNTKAREVLDYFNTKGFKDGEIVRSITENGVSTYVMGSWGDRPFTKYRISDHKVGPYREGTEIMFRHDTKPETLYRMSTGLKGGKRVLSGEEQQRKATEKSEYDTLWEQRKGELEGLRFRKWQSRMDMEEALKANPKLAEAKYLQQRVNKDGSFTYEYSEPGEQTMDSRPSLGFLRAMEAPKSQRARESKPELTPFRSVIAAAKKAMPDTKIVDKNGDPLVVYHDTNSKIYVNKETGEEWDNLDWRAKQEWEKRDDWDEYWKEKDFNTFDNKKHGRESIEMPAFFFSPKADPYHEYGKRRVSAFLNIKNPAINPEIENAGVTNTAGRDAMNKLIEQGYDGFIRTNEAGEIEEVAAFYPEQIKSADRVTYDDGGKPIPLDKRFDSSKSDIRYQLSTNDRLEAAKAEVEAEVTKAKGIRKSKLDEMDGVLKKVNKGLVTAAQRGYDRASVKAVTDLAKELVKEGYLNDIGRRDLKSIFTDIEKSTGKEELEKNVNRLMEIAARNLKDNYEAYIEKLTKVKPVSLKSGVKVRGRLEIFGQEMMKGFLEGRKTSVESIARMRDLAWDEYTKRGNDDAASRGRIAGLTIAEKYVTTIKDAEAELTERKAEFEAKKEELYDKYKKGEITMRQYREFKDAMDESLRKAELDIVDAYGKLAGELGAQVADSKNEAILLKKKELEHKDEILHLGNSDMEGKDDIGLRDKKKKTIFDRNAVSWFLTPISSFDMFLRQFGRKSVNGEGYLWNHFVRGAIRASGSEWTNVKKLHDELAAKTQELTGKKRWSDVMREKTIPIDVTILHKGKERTVTITQGNALAIYAWNKMEDGRMKLRAMGIDQTAIDAMMEKIKPEYKELIDWVQEKFFPKLAERYAPIYEKLFGAKMDVVENYFPLKVVKDEVRKEKDVDNPDQFDYALPSTMTGALKRRTVNLTPLDIINGDAFDIVLDYVQKQENWAAFAPLKKDLNILISDTHFMNQVKNMKTIYGSGDNLWNEFVKTAQMAVDSYKPAGKRSRGDDIAVNISKGVTAAKISFRVFTAAKQFLSFPAYIADANVATLAKNVAKTFATGDSWKWCMENLPLFRKRWESRIAGETRLMDTEFDWGLLRNDITKAAVRLGITPNAFVDALTVSIGAKSIYEGRLKRYLKDGYEREKAEQLAKEDAQILVNETQQSAEGAFLSSVQLDRTWFAAAVSTFRNASMGYQRQLIDAARNLKHMAEKGYKKEFMDFEVKRRMRQGLSEADARAGAERMWKRAAAHNTIRMAVFGYVLPYCWYLGGSLAYQLFGQDDEERKKERSDARWHAVAGVIEGLAGGNVISDAWNMAMNGDFKKEAQYWDMPNLPIASDIKDIYTSFGRDDVQAYNEIINLVIQAGIGVNPQTVTDVICAVSDAADGDFGTMREIGLLLMKLTQVPQTQLRKLYIDELHLNAEDAQKLSVEELAKLYTEKDLADRYAKEQVRRNAFFTRIAYDKEGKEKALKSKVRSFKGKVKERVKLLEDKGKLREMGVNDDLKGAKKAINDLKKEVQKEMDEIKKNAGLK